MRFSTVAFAALMMGAVAPAAAQDFWNMSCGDLWMARNQIYADAGYCFRTARAQRVFSNARCSFERQEDVPLSRDDRAAIAEIVRVERAKGCAN